MKRRISQSLLFLAVVFAMFSCKEQKDDNNSYTISGTVPVGIESEWIYMYRNNNVRHPVDSARIKKGSFVFKGVVDTVTFVTLHAGAIDEHPASSWNFILEPGDIVVDTLSMFASGTALNDGLADWMNKLLLMNSDMELRLFFRQHWAEHSGDFVGPFCLNVFSSYLEFAFVDSLMAQAAPELRDNPTLAPMYQHLDAIREMQPGKAFKDVGLQTLESNPVSLSDYIGKGDVVLLDFWASWCGPCRNTMADLQSVAARHRQLHVVGIAINDKPEDTRLAVKHLKITWPVVSDSRCDVARAYGINAIPAMVLFAADGTILARDFQVSQLDSILNSHSVR